MNQLDFSKIEVDDIYRKNDVGSHLNKQNHINLFLKNIFNKIED